VTADSDAAGITQKIVGITAAIIVFLLCVGGMIYFLKFKRKSSQFAPLVEDEETTIYTEQGAVKL